MTDDADNALKSEVIPLPREYVFVCSSSKHPGLRFDIRFASGPDQTSGDLVLVYQEGSKDFRVGTRIDFSVWGDVPYGQKVYHQHQVVGTDGAVIAEDGEWFQISKINDFAPASERGGYKTSVLVRCVKPGLPQYVHQYRIAAIRELLRKDNKDSGPIVASATYPTDILVTRN